MPILQNKLLIISQTLPIENGIGSEKRMHNWVKALSCRFSLNVVIITMHPTDKSRVVSESLIASCESFYINDVSDYELPRLNVRQRLFSKQPEFLSRWPLNKIKSTLRHLNGSNFDAVLVVRLRLLPIWRLLAEELEVISKRIVMDIDDIDSINYQRQLSLGGVRKYGKLGWLLQRLDIARMASLEASAAKTFEGLVLCSHDDLDS